MDMNLIIIATIDYYECLTIYIYFFKNTFVKHFELIHLNFYANIKIIKI